MPEGVGLTSTPRRRACSSGGTTREEKGNQARPKKIPFGSTIMDFREEERRE